MIFVISTENKFGNLGFKPKISEAQEGYFLTPEIFLFQNFTFYPSSFHYVAYSYRTNLFC